MPDLSTEQLEAVRKVLRDGLADLASPAARSSAAEQALTVALAAWTMARALELLGEPQAMQGLTAPAGPPPARAPRG